jgi:hypothetical protein
VRDREGLDAPAADVGTPEGAHGPEDAFVIADISDVGVAVCEKHSSFALPLLLDQGEELAERDLAFVGEFRDDRRVERSFEQLMDL